MAYRIEFAPKAARQFRALDKGLQRRLARRIDALAGNPRPQGVKKLAGEDDLYRLRVGDYRILYQIQKHRLIVLVVGVGHRSEIYRELRR
ncbi:MAG TPA: type II toxin-antitoxin system RelE/ParE family toxin [Candidatus Binatia bacterium]|nr:type II toxin-antitoxin system RelE/ParE family toxin [Candidatus Binatia bacterium]